MPKTIYSKKLLVVIKSPGFEMNFLDKEANDLDTNDKSPLDTLEATYEQTMLAFKYNPNHFKPELEKYYKHNYSKDRRRKKRRKRRRRNNMKRIEKNFGKPLTQKMDGYGSDSSKGSNESITSTGSGKGSLNSILSGIEGVPPKEWFLSRIRAMKDIFMLSWPIFLTSELLAVLYFINLLWVGHRYSSDQLAGASLACTMINIVGQSFIIGMSSSLDTLCGAAFGAGSYDMVGIYLQRMIVLIHLLIIVIAVIFLFSQPILQVLHQPPAVAKWSGKFAMTFIIALWPLAMWYCLRRYLQSQGKVKIIFPSVLFAVIGQAMGLYAFDVYLEWGFVSSALALGSAYWLQLISMIVLMWIGDAHSATWNGWKCSEMFKGWKQIVSLSFPALCMLCSEWWAFEMQAIFAGWISDDSLAGFALSLNFLTMTIKVPLAISWANGIVVANKLGKMRPDDASAAWDGALILSTIMTALISLCCWFGKGYIAHLYAPQPSHGEIRRIMEQCLQILAIYMMIDQIQRCGQGAIRGMGMQKVGAFANVLSYYLIGIPVGLFLCFKLEWKVNGLWIGMCLASIVSSVVFLVMRWRVNWREQVKRAFARMQEKEKTLVMFQEEMNGNKRMRFRVQIDSDDDYGVDNDQNDGSFNSSTSSTEVTELNTTISTAYNFHVSADEESEDADLARHPS